MTKWFERIQQSCIQSIEINYQSIGSGGGITQLTQDGGFRGVRHAP